MNNENLLQQIRSGDGSVLNTLYTEYREPFFAYLHQQYKLDRDMVTEIYQLTMVIFYDNVVSGKLKHLSSGIKTYLFAIGKNKAREHQRKKRRITEHLDEVLIDSIMEEDGIQEKEKFETDILKVTHALEKLGDPCKQIIQLYYYQKRSMDEISQTMNYKNADTTKNQKYRCIKQLQKMFHDILVK